jgi:hypothetical protein
MGEPLEWGFITVLESTIAVVMVEFSLCAVKPQIS